eukprot:scaffold119867_cov42-Phaeocystis_antarctica.AAC.1
MLQRRAEQLAAALVVRHTGLEPRNSRPQDRVTLDEHTPGRSATHMFEPRLGQDAAPPPSAPPSALPPSAPPSAPPSPPAADQVEE